MAETTGPILPEELVSYMEELEEIESIHPDERDRVTIERQKTLCKQLLQQIDKTATPELWAVAQAFLGDAYETLYKRFGTESDGSIAEGAYLAALKHMESIQSPFRVRLIPGLQQSLGRLYGTMYENTGLVHYSEQAEIAYHTALQIFAEDEQWKDWASIQNSLGHLYSLRFMSKKETNYAEAAIAAYRSALKIRGAASDRRQLGDTENNLATVYQQLYRQTHQHEYAHEAEAGFQRALDLCDVHTDPLGWARIRNNLGLLYTNMYYHMGDERYAKTALRAYDDALKEFYDKKSFTWAEIQNNRALLFIFKYIHNPKDKYIQAIEDIYQLVLDVFSPMSAPIRVAATARSAALILLHLQRWQEAHRWFTIALDTVRNLYLKSPGGPQRRQFVAQYADLCMQNARCLLHLGDLAAAWSQAEAGRTLQLLEAVGLEVVAYNQYGEEGVERIRKSRRKVQEAEANLVTISPKPKNFIERLVFQEVLNDRERARQKLEEAYRELNALIRFMELEVPTINPAELLDLSLPSNAAAITIILTAEETIALILHNGKIVSVPLPQFSSRYVDSLVNAIPLETIEWCEKYAPQMAAHLKALHRAQLEEENEEKQAIPAGTEVPRVDVFVAPFEGDDKPLTHTGWLIAYMIAFAIPDSISSRARRTAVYGWHACVSRTLTFLKGAFWQPILAKLPSSVHKILLIPSGATALLPLHAAVIDSLTVAYIPSLSVWHLCQQRTPDRTEQSSLIANPNYEKLGSLEFADAETQWLQHKLDNAGWSTLKLLGDEATVSAVCHGTRGKEVIHYAGHAKYNWIDPIHSALECADGKLTISVIRQIMDLRSARLVILSACESGISDTSTSAEEFLGLPAVMLEVGAPAVVASLWPAADVSTAFLMDQFYEIWLIRKGNVTIADALREAVLWLRSVTKDDLLHRIGSSVLPLRQQKSLIKILQPLDELPFSDPAFWGVFAAYGAVL